MTKIKSINSNQLYIAQKVEVSLKLAGNTAQVTFTAGKNRKCPIKNLSKDEFVDLSTGEVKMRRHAENRYQSPKSVRKSINSLMNLIRCNATNHSNCKWITLTYREEMTDCKRVSKDNKAFLRKLRSYQDKEKNMTIDELYDLVEEYYGYKIHMKSLNSQTNEVSGLLYDSFVLKCDINDRYGRFGAGIDIGNEGTISVFLGKHCSLNSDRKSIEDSLKIIDDYCRLRLPDKFLDAYYKAYCMQEDSFN